MRISRHTALILSILVLLGCLLVTYFLICSPEARLIHRPARYVEDPTFNNAFEAPQIIKTEEVVSDGEA